MPPAQPGELFANFGPLDAPLFDGDAPPAIAVLPRLDGLPGRWVCIGRRFIAVDDWRERDAIREEG